MDQAGASERDGGEKRAEILRGEKVGKRIKPSCERGAGRPTGEVGDGDLAFARTERIGGEFAETERVGRVDRGHSGCFTVARRVNLGKKRAQRPKEKSQAGARAEPLHRKLQQRKRPVGMTPPK